MPLKSYHPDLINRVTRTNSEVLFALQQEEKRQSIPLAASHSSFSLVPITKKLKIQHEMYQTNNLQDHSLFSQINCQFSKKLDNFNGICFIDFDNTIINCESLDREYQASIQARKPFELKDHRYYYNAQKYTEWEMILDLLISRKYLIVLYTNRIALEGEDELLQKIVDEDLKDRFHFKLFAGALAPKGFVIDFIRKYIERNQGIIFDPKSIFLVDDEKQNLDSAARFQISIIQSYPLRGISPSIFMCQLYTLPMQQNPRRVECTPRVFPKHGSAAILETRSEPLTALSKKSATPKFTDLVGRRSPTSLLPPPIEIDSDGNEYFPISIPLLEALALIEKIKTNENKERSSLEMREHAWFEQNENDYRSQRALMLAVERQRNEEIKQIHLEQSRQIHEQRLRFEDQEASMRYNIITDAGKSYQDLFLKQLASRKGCVLLDS